MEALSPEVPDADVEDVRTIGRKGTGRGRVEVLARERRRTWTPEQKRAIVAESLGSAMIRDFHHAQVERRRCRRPRSRANTRSAVGCFMRGGNKFGEARSVSAPDPRPVLRRSSWPQR